jgi:hypothetical protein
VPGAAPAPTGAARPRPGTGRPDSCFQGDDAPEGHLIPGGEVRVAGKGLDAALVGAQFVSGLFEQFADTPVRYGRAKRCPGRPQRRAIRRPAASAFICAAAAARA